MGATSETNGVANGSSSLPILKKDDLVPLIIDGKDVKLDSKEHHYCLPESHDPTTPSQVWFQGTTDKITIEAIESCQRAYPAWSRTGPPQRRLLLQALARVIRENETPIRALIKEEIHCDDWWTWNQVAVTCGIIEDTAASISSETMNGQIPTSVIPGVYPLVFNEPYGVILGIAPWNAPLILGLRSFCAAVAAGNTVVFKGSEFSPRTHYMLAKLVQQVGFPPGVVNFIIHRPEDAIATFDTLIQHPAIKKVNFTGSTAVGRSIAVKAAQQLKPVLLELGGKNISIVLDDADLHKAAKETLDATLLNNGQICMSTDTALVARPVVEEFTKILHEMWQKIPEVSSRTRAQNHVISSKGRDNITRLIDDAKSKGAKVTHAAGTSDEGNLYPATIIENLTDDMAYHKTESFGPIVGIRSVDTEEDILKYFHESGYGLSSSVFSKDQLRAINLARKLEVGAVHVNGGSVHDEGNHPHGGVGLSGYGRFGGTWALREFTRTKTVILYP